jgi:protein ImuB
MGSVELLDAQGNPVRVTGRGLFSAEPVRLDGADVRGALTWWAGPWPVDERWWDPEHARIGRTARAQVLIDGEPPQALLLCYRQRQWHLEGVYE